MNEAEASDTTIAETEKDYFAANHIPYLVSFP